MIKNIFDRFVPTRWYNGLSPDTRSPKEKAKDWQAIEIYSPEPPIFRPVREREWKKYQTRNQDGSGSCVANTIAKILEVKRKIDKGDDVKFSHAPIYIHRVNRPSPGMVGHDALQLAIKYSSCREENMLSENKNDAQLDNMPMPADYESLNNLVSPTNYLICPTDFDYAASMVAKEGAVMLWVDTSYSNWNRDIPVAGGKGGGVRHSITIVDAIKFDGVEYLVIEDSWGKFGKYDGQRLITREFFKENAFVVAVLTSFKYDVVDSEFDEFKTILVLGDRGVEVDKLQRFLKKEGLFPSNVVNKDPSKAYYGNMTATAVYNFQIRYAIDTIPVLNTLKGKRVGSKTLEKINTLIKK